jgi:hypothetical protein
MSAQVIKPENNGAMEASEKRLILEKYSINQSFH